MNLNRIWKLTCCTENSKSSSRSGPEHRWTFSGALGLVELLDVSTELKYIDHNTCGFVRTIAASSPLPDTPSK